MRDDEVQGGVSRTYWASEGLHGATDWTCRASRRRPGCVTLSVVLAPASLSTAGMSGASSAPYSAAWIDISPEGRATVWRARLSEANPSSASRAAARAETTSSNCGTPDSPAGVG